MRTVAQRAARILTDALRGGSIRHNETVRLRLELLEQRDNPSTFLIDDYSTPQVLTAVGAPVVTVNGFVNGGAGIIGGQREAVVTKLTGSSPAQVNLRVDTSGATLDSGLGSTGQLLLVYDGSGDAGATGVNPGGLGGVNLAATTSRFDVTAGTDLSGAGVQLRVTVYTFNGTSYVPTSVTRLVPVNTLDVVTFDFSAFTGANFSNVGAITLEVINSPQAADTQITLFCATGVADLSLTKGVSNTTPAVGDIVTYTVTLSNAGPNGADGVTVTDVIPAGTQFLAVQPGTTGTFNAVTGLWTIPGTIAANSSVQLIYTAQVVTAAVTTNFAEVATANAIDPDSTPGNNSTNEDDDASATITPRPVDFGDAPTAAQSGFASSYPTLLADIGARHIATGPTLGASRTTELNGQPNATATGDVDSGVTLPAGGVARGVAQNITVNVAGGAGFLNAWFDLNRDGDWDDAGEQILTNRAVSNGNNTISITLPAGTALGTTFARFRLTQATVTAASPRGLLPTGEVEDYQLDVIEPADIRVTKTVDNASPALGTTVTFTVTATNLGPGLASGVTVSDLLPAGLSLITATASPGTSYVSGTGVWTIGSLALNGSATLSLLVRVNAAGAITNTASLGNITPGDRDPSNNSGSATVTAPAEDFGDAPDTFGTLLANNGARHVATGPLLGATRDTENNGQPNATATGDGADEDGVTLPAQGLVIGANNTITISGTVGGIINAWIDYNRDGDFLDAGEQVLTNLAATGPGQSVVLAVPATASSGGSFIRFRIASVGGLTSVGRATDGEVEDYAVALRTVADLELTKTVSSPTANLGDTVVFTLSLFNRGPGDATGVAVRDALPAGLAYVSDNGGGAFNNGTSTWTIGNLALGATTTLQITARVTAAGVLSNYAQVQTSNQLDPDSTPGNNSTTEDDDDTVPVTVAAQDFGDAPNTYGTLLSSNGAGHIATGPTLGATRDTENDGQPNASATGDGADEDGVTLTPGGFIIGTSNTITVNTSAASFVNVWVDYNRDGDFGDAGEQALTNVPLIAGNNTLTLAVPVSASGGASFARFRLTSAAVLTPNPIGLLPDGEVEDYAVLLVNQADLSLTKTISNPTPRLGETVTFTLSLSNTGPNNATGVTVRDLLPAGLSYVSDTGGGSYTSGTGIWNIGALANGGTTTIQIMARVTAPGTLVNYAQVQTANQPDPDSTPGNNSTTEDDDDSVTIIVGDPELQVVKDVLNADTSIDAGTVVNYQVFISHTGASTAAAFNVRVTDALAAVGLNLNVGSINITAPGYATSSNGSNASGVDLTLSELRPGDSITVTYAATLNGPAGGIVPAPGSTVINTALVNSMTAPVGGFNEPTISDTAQVTVNSYSIAGEIYYDANNNGLRDGSEPLIMVATDLRLIGTDAQGNAVSTPFTATVGTYAFTGLRPGTYRVVQETQPTGYLDGRDTPGTPFGGTGTADSDPRAPRDAEQISGIVIPPNAAQNGTANAGVNYNFGELLPASIGNFVWNDVNGDGVQQGTEPGINVVTVALSGTDDTGATVTASQPTTGNGGYNFTNLRPGTYTVTFGNSDGATTYIRTLQNAAAGTPANDSDGDRATGLTAPIALVAGRVITNIDQGLYTLATLGDRVFIDANGNGIQDGTEASLGGVTVELYDAIGTNLLQSTTTDAVTGLYSFSVDQGTYTVRFVAPAGFVFTTPNLGGNPALDSDANQATGFTLPIVVPAQAAITNIDAGVYQLASVGDTVWFDYDNSGTQNGTEPGLAGVTVRLTYAGPDGSFGTADDPAGFTSVTTGASGTYLFANLAPGTYRTTIDTATLPAGLNTQTFDLDNLTGPFATPDQAEFTLTTGQDRTDADFGYRGTASLGDTVFFDIDRSGTQNNGEPGIAGATITLAWAGRDGILGSADDVNFPNQTTNAAGQYSFTNLPAGSYRVAALTASLPAGASVATVDFDSGPPSADALASVPLASGQARTDADFGFTGTGAIGDRIWLDQNADGVQDPSEPGVPGAVVRLTWFGPTGTDNATITAITDANGNYNFPSLPPDNYRVDVLSVPPGLALSGDPDGTLDGSNSLTLTSGQIVDTADFGYRGTGSLAGTVYVDLNNNAVLEATETRILGVTVSLSGTDVFGNAITASTTTLADGTYSFANLVPGVYRINETQPSAYSDGIDSVGTVNGSPSGTTSNDQFAGINLTPDQAGVNYNFGELPGSISGRVFLDSNRDGVLDSGEGGLANVTVQLRDAGGTVIDTTATDANGNYSFTNLPAGTYTVEELTPAEYGDSPTGPFAPNTRSITLPAGGTSTNQNFGDTLGSLAGVAYVDLDNSGTLTAGDTRLSGVTITLTGSTTVGVFQLVATTDANGNYRFDGLPASTVRVTETQPLNYINGPENVGTVNGTPAGTATDNEIAGITIPAGGVGSDYNFGELTPTGTFIAGTVFIDRNRDGQPGGAAETGLPGITLRLLDAAGTVVATTTTDANGGYLFTGLQPGNFTIEEVQPGGYGSSTPNVLAVTVPVNGLIGQNFGETISSLAGTVYADNNGNGILDVGDTRLPGVRVDLSGTDVNGNGVNLFSFTDPSGNYIFMDLLAGSYAVTETQPANYNDSTDSIGSAGGFTSPTDTIATIPLGAGVDAAGYNFGELGTQVSGRVFADRDRNGVQNGTEPGLPNITVNLIDDAGNIVGTTTTDASGDYRFTNIPAGNYTILEVQPSGYGDTPVGAFQTNTRSVSVPLAGLTGQNFGDILGSIAGQVFVDLNDDGTRQMGEPPVPGTIITLTGTDVDGNPVFRSTTTGADGSYIFDELPAGTYVITETQPQAFEDGTDTGGTSGGSVGNDTVSNIVLAAGVQATAYDFGELVPEMPAGTTSITGVVYLDTNRNGTLESGERGFGGVTIELLDSAGNTLPGFPPIQTNPDGTFEFDGVPPGDYIIRETQPAGFGSSEAPTNERMVNVPASLVPVTGQNFGETAGSLSGIVYEDVNTNGVYDLGIDRPIAGAAVSLDGLSVTGFLIPPSIALTNADGTYRFDGLIAGTYQMGEFQPAGFNQGTNTIGTVNGTPTGMFGTGPDSIVQINLPAGQDGINFNFGEIRPLTTITGTVFRDVDRDGILNGTDSGLISVAIQLLDPAGNVVAMTTTIAGGTYTFTDVIPGNYTIHEVQPVGYGSSTPDDLAVTVPLGGLTDQNFGDTLASIAGSVFVDVNNDGLRNAGEPGIAGVTVTLTNLDDAGFLATVTTLADGSYLFDGLFAGNYRIVETHPVAYVDGQEAIGSAGGALTSTDTFTAVPLGAGVAATQYTFGELGSALTGTVYHDRNVDSTYQPGSDTPLAGVLITLRDSGGNVVDTTTTAMDGTYSFVGIAADTYTIEETQPTGYGSSEAPTNVRTVVVPLVTTVGGQNFGETLGSIAGTVYNDFNLSGVFDTTAAVPDTGIGGIILTLLDGTGTAIRNGTTDAFGNYLFEDLPTGSYTVVETQPPLPTTLFNGYYDGADNLGSLNGTQPAKNQLALVLGIDVQTQQSERATDYNFGELPPADPNGFVYVDRNRNGIKDPGEVGIANVAITISGTAFAGTPFARPITGADVPGGSLTIFTNSLGFYEFTPIPPGLYSISEAQPAGFIDGLEQDGDPNGPPATVGNDVFTNILLAPFPIRGPFNFGEWLVPQVVGPIPPIDFFPPTAGGSDPSKRDFLGSTSTVPVSPAAPLGPTDPGFALFNPGVRVAQYAAIAEDVGGGYVRVFDFAAGLERFRFQPFGDFTGGVRVAAADVSGDGIPDIIAVPGLGGGPVVKVFDGSTGQLLSSTMVFEESFRGGLQVTAADLNGDFQAEIIVTPDAGGGPVVKVLDGATLAIRSTFLALDESFRGGLRIATGDVNNDGTPDLLVTAGIGGGPRIAGYNGTTLLSTPTRLFGDFFGFAPELRNGFWISSADVNGDGFADIFLGAGDGGAPRVVVYSGQALATGSGPQTLTSYFAGDPATRSGVRISARDLDGDNVPELVAAPGAGSLPIVSIVNPLTGVARTTFYGFPTNFRGGVSVG